VFPPGQYSFPFSFILKEDLPGSFSKKEYLQPIGHAEGESKGPKNSGKIKYKIKAGLKSESLKLALYDKFKIVIDEKFDEGARDILATPFDQEVKGYCYTSHGSYKLAAIATTNKYLVGDQATVSFSIDASDASSNITNVKAYLQMKTHLIAKGYQQELKEDIVTIDLGEVESGSKRVDENCMQVTFEIKTPEELQATTSGKLVKNSFFLKIKCEIDGCVCYSESPLVSFPISVFNKHYGPQALPNVLNIIPNWEPQTYDPYICEMDENFKMGKDYRKNMRGFYNN
jgi:sulfur transfer complex TusBCD TusB component (DsrH family)